MAAIAAGKHVYVQKSMTATLAEADALLDARDRAGVKLSAAPGYELCTTTAALRRVVRRGVLGRVYVGHTYTFGFGGGVEPRPGVRDPLAEIDPSWLYRAGGGGPLPHITVYSLQLLTSILGPVHQVTMLANRLSTERRWRERVIPIEIDDNNVVVLEFAAGTLVTAVGANARGSKHTQWGGLSLHGSAGALEVTDVHLASGYPLRFEIEGGQWEGGNGAAGIERSYAASLADQPYLSGEHLTLPEPHVYADIMDLVDAIQQDRPTRATGEQARHVVEIIERAQQAAKTGQTQTVASSFETVAEAP